MKPITSINLKWLLLLGGDIESNPGPPVTRQSTSHEEEKCSPQKISETKGEIIDNDSQATKPDICIELNNTENHDEDNVLNITNKFKELCNEVISAPDTLTEYAGDKIDKQHEEIKELKKNLNIQIEVNKKMEEVLHTKQIEVLRLNLQIEENNQESQNLINETNSNAESKIQHEVEKNVNIEEELKTKNVMILELKAEVEIRDEKSKQLETENKELAELQNSKAEINSYRQDIKGIVEMMREKYLVLEKVSNTQTAIIDKQHIFNQNTETQN